MKWEVNFFQSERNEYPVQVFLAKLDEKTIAKVIHHINLLENFGPFLRPPFIKKIQPDLFELRILGLVAIRILYTKKEHKFILLHGFAKRAQKTPRKEIKTALARMKKLI